ncbi:protein naked cuticle-like 1 [Silurus asotus]|uniref:Protein naked cuticle homolog n=1 Tax=Silurus asotus TaxID=30991 RepID=A0AAD5B1I7_SILAS|nr:protein naked cuticle-like 1 [Silurus asotus]
MHLFDRFIFALVFVHFASTNTVFPFPFPNFPKAAICKPRESPEGDSFVVNACLARKGLDDWLVKQKYYCASARLEQQDCPQKSTCGTPARDPLKDACAEGISDEHYRLEVALPPEKIDSFSGEEKMMDKENSAAAPHKQLQFEELECAVSVEEDNRQEWTFTLYDFDNNGKVTREDITSLLHTIYEVVDASVNHSPSSSKTLRVKLSVSPDASQRWRNGSGTHANAEMTHPRLKSEKCFEEHKSSDKKSRALLRRHHSDHHTQQSCQRHCVDENLERRNHYLDLAGIENYSSRFGTAAATTEPPKPDHTSRPSNQTRSRSQEAENGHSHPVHHHRRSHTISNETPAMQDSLCLRSRVQDSTHHSHSVRSPKAQPSCSRVMKRGPAPPLAPPVNAAPHQISAPYRRHKQRHREGPSARGAGPPGRGTGPVVSSGQAVEKEQVRELPSVVLYEGGLAQVVQRHEHHHHHEHHYHYHHFYQS